MAKDEFDFVGFDVFVVNLGIGVSFELLAEGTLEVAEFDDSYFGIWVAEGRKVTF